MIFLDNEERKKNIRLLSSGRKNTLRFRIKKYSLFPFPLVGEKSIVALVDGNVIHGGLTDRLCHILSLYSYCKEHNLRFYVKHVYPFCLEEMLSPNIYDWTIKKDDFNKTLYNTDTLLTIRYPNVNVEKQITYHKKLLYRLVLSHRPMQFHVYGNACFNERQFPALYHELFRPTDRLQEKVKQQIQEIGEEYEAVVLRFQQLLGDFVEGDYDVLNEVEQKKLINKLIEKISELYYSGYFSTKLIIVTSDSTLFLNAVSCLPFVKTHSNMVVHMDYTADCDCDVYMQSFVDLYMLMNSKKITLLKSWKMYFSGFPRFAAQIAGLPFNCIDI